MKRIIFLAFVCMSFGICNAQESNVSAPESNVGVSVEKETVEANKLEHDFGTISESSGLVSCDFFIKNTGKTPVVITKVTTSCGCTAPDWSKEPIVSGKEGFIKVTFNPKGYNGDFTKTLVVFTNGEPQSIRLKIKGNVK